MPPTRKYIPGSNFTAVVRAEPRPAGPVHRAESPLISYVYVGGPATPLASIAGRVVNARTGDPVAEARVVLDSADHVTISDLDGRFTFDGLLPGPYVVRVTDSIAVPGERARDASAGETIGTDTSMADTSAARTTAIDRSARSLNSRQKPRMVACRRAGTGSCSGMASLWPREVGLSRRRGQRVTERSRHDDRSGASRKRQ